MQRDDAYRIVQEAAQRAWDERIALRELLTARPEFGLDLDAIFDVRYAPEDDRRQVGERHGRQQGRGCPEEGRRAQGSHLGGTTRWSGEIVCRLDALTTSAVRARDY